MPGAGLCAVTLSFAAYPTTFSRHVSRAAVTAAQAAAGDCPRRSITLTRSALVVGTVVVWSFAGWFWRVGLRNYTGASA